MGLKNTGSLPIALDLVSKPLTLNRDPCEFSDGRLDLGWGVRGNINFGQCHIGASSLELIASARNRFWGAMVGGVLVDGLVPEKVDTSC